MEKKPRRIEETGGAGDDNYYPSGDRERRPGLEPFGSSISLTSTTSLECHFIAESGDTRDSWTDLQPGDSERQPPPQQREESNSNTLQDLFPLEPLEPLEPKTEENVLEPVRTDRPRPRLEDDDGWAAQRKPWLPDINTDIKSFEDIFGNVVDSYAEPRTSGATSLVLERLNLLVLCGAVALLGLATQ